MGGILSAKAEALRLLATKLEQLGNDFPKQAKEVVRMFAPKNCLKQYTQRIELDLANDSSFVKHCVERAGIELGRDIGKDLAAKFTGLRKPNYSDPNDVLARLHVAEYAATVVVMSPKQLEDLVQQALEIGRATTALGSKFDATPAGEVKASRYPPMPFSPTSIFGPQY